MVTIIGMVGLPASGKTTLAREIVDRFGFSLVNKDDMRDYLIKNVTYFKDAPYSHSNPLIRSVNRVVRPASDRLLLELLEQEQDVIIDGYGKSKENRDRYIEITKSFNPKLVIVYVKEKEDVILERLRKRDLVTKNKWIESYHDRWKPNFSVPTENECDHLIEVQGDFENALDELGHILKR